MKKIAILGSALLLALNLMVVSCSNGNDSSNNNSGGTNTPPASTPVVTAPSIIGTWVLNQEALLNNSEYPKAMTFFDNGTARITGRDGDMQDATYSLANTTYSCNVPAWNWTFTGVFSATSLNIKKVLD